MIRRLLFTFVCLLIFYLLVPFSLARAENSMSYLVTEGFDQDIDIHSHRYFLKALTYTSGEVYISANPDGTGSMNVGDRFRIWNILNHQTFTFDASEKCYKQPPKQMPPLNVTHLFVKDGFNNFTLHFDNPCFDNHVSGGRMYVVVKNITEPGPKPFLDLPWDYKAAGMTFGEAALTMTSYFDHEYPLLSSSIKEPESFNKTIITFQNKVSEDLAYTSHDGYDYAAAGGLKMGGFVRAAAHGYATYHNECQACGQAIHIDHANSYQTRYYHLQPDWLVISNPAQSREVAAGQVIGKVGATGNVRPAGAAGAHLHFMVVQDKNFDGHFDDNIPDGITDPYGWSTADPDPWPLFTFDQNNKEKSGNTSYYLWKYLTADHKIVLHESWNNVVPAGNGARFTFPPQTVSEDVLLRVQVKPPVKTTVTGQKLESVGTIVGAVATDGFDTVIGASKKWFSLMFDFHKQDISRYTLASLAIYSSTDGASWQKENTTVDWDKKTATVNINHLTDFALMGEKIDVIAPNTEATLEAKLRDPLVEAVYLSPVRLYLSAVDEPAADSLGVDYTLYQVNNQGWNEYLAPLEFTEEKQYKFEFYSVDGDNNKEEIKSLSFTIDNLPLPTPTVLPTETPSPIPTTTLTPTPTTNEVQPAVKVEPSATPTPFSPTATSAPQPTATSTPIVLSQNQELIPSPTPEASPTEKATDKNEGEVLGTEDQSNDSPSITPEPEAQPGINYFYVILGILALLGFLYLGYRWFFSEKETDNIR